MAVMKKLTVGGVTYDTVGEASVTQVQTTGTKIATVSIDGTNTDIYAPSGSSVEPATANPVMDGTAAVGSSAKYAREDHVHPKDTSKVDASATDSTLTSLVNNWGYQVLNQVTDSSAKTRGKVLVTETGVILDAYDTNAHDSKASVQVSTTGDVFISSDTATYISNVATPTNNGDAVPKSYVDTGLSGKQATLVSGTNIKTVNSTSLLGSGNVAVQPTLVSGTNIKTVNSTSLLGSGDIAVQATLVSGVNIKTINGESVLGNGDIIAGGGSSYDIVITCTADTLSTNTSDYEITEGSISDIALRKENQELITGMITFVVKSYDDEEDQTQVTHYTGTLTEIYETYEGQTYPGYSSQLILIFVFATNRYVRIIMNDEDQFLGITFGTR